MACSLNPHRQCPETVLGHEQTSPCAPPITLACKSSKTSFSLKLLPLQFGIFVGGFTVAACLIQVVAVVVFQWLESFRKELPADDDEVSCCWAPCSVSLCCGASPTAGVYRSQVWISVLFSLSGICMCIMAASNYRVVKSDFRSRVHSIGATATFGCMTWAVIAYVWHMHHLTDLLKAKAEKEAVAAAVAVALGGDESGGKDPPIVVIGLETEGAGKRIRLLALTVLAVLFVCHLFVFNAVKNSGCNGSGFTSKEAQISLAECKSDSYKLTDRYCDDFVKGAYRNETYLFDVRKLGGTCVTGMSTHSASQHALILALLVFIVSILAWDAAVDPPGANLSTAGHEEEEEGGGVAAALPQQQAYPTVELKQVEVQPAGPALCRELEGCCEGQQSQRVTQ